MGSEVGRGYAESNGVRGGPEKQKGVASKVSECKKSKEERRAGDIKARQSKMRCLPSSKRGGRGARTCVAFPVLREEAALRAQWRVLGVPI